MKSSTKELQDRNQVFSEKHIAALHAGPALNVSTTLGHDGEENMDMTTAQVTSTWTQVCGNQGVPALKYA